MTMTIDISPEEEALLKEEAARRGKTPNDLLRTAFMNLIVPSNENRPSWSDAAGMFDYPLVGEDAQAWVTRTRREGDEHRERVLRGDTALPNTARADKAEL